MAGREWAEAGWRLLRATISGIMDDGLYCNYSGRLVPEKNDLSSYPKWLLLRWIYNCKLYWKEMYRTLLGVSTEFVLIVKAKGVT